MKVKHSGPTVGLSPGSGFLFSTSREVGKVVNTKIFSEVKRRDCVCRQE